MQQYEKILMQNTKWKQPGTKKYTLYDSIFRKFNIYQ